MKYVGASSIIPGVTHKLAKRCMVLKGMHAEESSWSVVNARVLHEIPHVKRPRLFYITAQALGGCIGAVRRGPVQCGALVRSYVNCAQA